MIASYLRSSSISSWDICQHSYWISYCLGHRQPSGRAATIGSMCHKALECLARQKLAVQNGEPAFTDPETEKTFSTQSFTSEEGVALAWDHYSRKETHLDWTPRDRREVERLTLQALTLAGGKFNPLNRTVVVPEQYFDLPVERDWARYRYALPGGGRAEGQLAIKGTVDLVTELDADTLEYCDWKSGRHRKDWATGEEKDWKKLKEDPQLRLYHYALSRLYPDRKHIIVTVIYIQNGGPFSLDFGPQDIPKTEAMLREKFEAIRDCERPTRIIHDPSRRFWCEKICHYGKEKFVGPDGKKSRQTICEHLHRELLSLGMSRAMAKHARPGAFDDYGEGGGRSGKKGATA